MNSFEDLIPIAWEACGESDYWIRVKTAVKDRSFQVKMIHHTAEFRSGVACTFAILPSEAEARSYFSTMVKAMDRHIKAKMEEQHE